MPRGRPKKKVVETPKPAEAKPAEPEKKPLDPKLQAVLDNFPWNKFIKQVPFAKQMAFLLIPHKEAFWGGAAGGSKVLYDDGEILTPFGFKRGADIKVGTLVNNPDGSISRITLLHPRKEFQVWRVWFHDGTFTDVGKEHLWLAWRSGKRKKRQGVSKFGESGAEVIPTEELKRWCDRAIQQELDGLRPHWPCIPVCKPQRFNVSKRWKCEIDPYVLGCWLGDGHISTADDGYISIGITSLDLDHTRAYLGTSGITYRENEKQDTEALTFQFTKRSRDNFILSLMRVKLSNGKSHTKFIPSEYKLGPIEVRLSVLQGLMDTDGTVDERGQVSFISTSERLADDVKFIIQSLGGTATLSIGEGWYRSKKTGRKIWCKRIYMLYIKLRNEKQLFRLQRKRKRCLATGSHMYRSVRSVGELKEKRFGRCITVAHPNGLYMTNDFIVTHNSSGLLIASLQYVTYPGYAALILRKSFADLKLPGALISRSHNWLDPWQDKGECKWNTQEHCWYFPTKYPDGSPGEPAKLQFGYIGKEGAKERYQSSEYQFIGIDEATQIKEADYTFMFSRLRKNACQVHKVDANGDPIYVAGCMYCQIQAAIPLRFRAASNPGGISHAHIKRRFDIGPHMNEVEAKKKGIEIRYIGRNPERPFLPAGYRDNPHINQNEYENSLNNLDPITRAQLLKGDWGVSPDSRFKKHWIKYYSYRGPYISLGEDGNGPVHEISSFRKIFLTVDPAGSFREGFEGSSIIGEKSTTEECSWTVIIAWALTSDFNLLLLDMDRFREEVPDVNPAIVKMYKRWKARYTKIESNGLGRGIYQSAMRDGLIVKPNNKDSDKVVNATEAILLMKAGRIWFPQSYNKLETIEDEVFTWMGDPEQTDDIVDCIADAAKEVSEEGDYSGLDSIGSTVPHVDANLPGTFSNTPGLIEMTPRIGFGGYGGYY